MTAEAGAMIKAVTFDMWNTLVQDIDYTEPRVQYLLSALKTANTPRSHDQVKGVYSSSYEYARKVSRNENYRYVTTEERLGYILKRLSAELTEDLKADVLRAFEEVAGTDPPPLAKGVSETLGQLRSDYRMGIVSDSGLTPGRVLKKVLLSHRILGFFDSTVFSNEVGYNKPHNAMFERALAALDVKPHEAVHLGDLLHTDIVGAKGAGMKAVWLNNGQMVNAGPCFPDSEIRAFSEMVNALRRIS